MISTTDCLSMICKIMKRMDVDVQFAGAEEGTGGYLRGKLENAR